MPILPPDIGHSTLASLLRLTPHGEQTFRSCANERNPNGHVYGGQLMGQLVAAAAETVDAARAPTMLQVVFMHGARPEVPIDYQVAELQSGSRFSTRQVRATQGSRSVANAHISFQVAAAGLEHQQALVGPVPMPEMLPEPLSMDSTLLDRIRNSGYSEFVPHPFIEYRFVDPMGELHAHKSGTAIRMWSRIREKLPNEPLLQASALAYLSDWWTSYAGLAPHISIADTSRFVTVSLNHSLWFHAPCRADEWLLWVLHSPCAASLRTLSLASLYTREGKLVASIAQEALLTKVIADCGSR